MIGPSIAFMLGNFTLSFFFVALMFAGVTIARLPKPVSRASVMEKLISWFVFWTIGVLFIVRNSLPMSAKGRTPRIIL
jgi:hypothetical protein